MTLRKRGGSFLNLLQKEGDTQKRRVQLGGKYGCLRLSNDSLYMWNSSENRMYFTSKTLLLFKCFREKFPANKSSHVHF